MLNRRALLHISGRGNYYYGDTDVEYVTLKQSPAPGVHHYPARTFYASYTRIAAIGLPTMRKARCSASHRMRSMSSVRYSPWR